MKVNFVFFFCVFFAFISCKKNTIQAEPETPEVPVPVVVSKSEVEDPDIGSVSVIFEGEVLLNQQDNEKFTKRVWQGIPSVEISNDGVIYSTWYSGGAGENPGNYVVLSMSNDLGKTWKQNCVIINPTSALGRFYDPTIWKDKYGTIFLSWAESKSTGIWDGKGGVWYSIITNLNGSVKLSAPRKLTDGVMMNKASASLDKKKMFYPIAVWNLSQYTNLDGIDIYSTLLNDKYKKSTSFTKVSTIKLKPTLRLFDEHQLVQLADSSYIAMIRGIDGIYITSSKNLSSWTEPVKFTQVGATTSARFFLGRLSSGKIALILNNSTGRNNLKIFLSDDEAKTWKYSLLIDNREGVSYPDLTQAEDGTIYVVYDYSRFSALQINCVSFKESDVITANSSNIKKFVISQK